VNFGFLIALLFLLLIGIRAAAGYFLEYEWWKELGQLETWYSQLLYGVLPVVAAGLIAFVIFWISHARGLKTGGSRLSQYPVYARLSTVGLLLLGFLVALATINTWAVVRFFGGAAANAANAWRDPAFGKPLAFYLFDLPFFSVLLSYILTVSLIAAVIHWLAAGFWHLRDQFTNRMPGEPFEISGFRLSPAFGSGFLRFVLAIFLLALAVRFYLDRYDLLLEDHGFMVGMDWIGETIEIPLLWICAAASIVGAGFAILGRYRWILLLLILLPIQTIFPRIVSAVYVRPNEISIQKPYIVRHIAATRSAWGLEKDFFEKNAPVKAEAPFDPNKNRALLDNVRLWDWRPFHDTVSQLQPIRPYVYSDSDVDRYMIDGQLRQVLLAPREIESHHRERPARSLHPRRAAQGQHANTQTDASRNLLRRTGARPRVRPNRAA
jgi:uncharacterized membrane protein (UPF0182 family)